MKRTGNKNLKIIAATMVTIFSLFACFTATYAWFAATRKVNNGADTFKVESFTGILESVSVHKLNRASSSDATFAFNKTPVENKEMIIDWNTATPTTYVSTELDRYNPLEIHNPVLMLFKFKDGTLDKEIQIRSNSSSTSFVGYVENKDDNPLSSVIKFQSISFASDPTSDANNYLVTKQNLSDDVHFVNVTHDDAGYPTVDEDTGFVSTQIIYQGTTENAVEYVGVVVDYYEPAMSYLFAVNLGNRLFEMDVADENAGVINFICDWSMTI